MTHGEIMEAGGAIGAAAGEREAARADDLAEWAAVLEESPPIDVLRWAADRYAPRVTLATGFGAEGCALIDLIARERLAIDLFTLDTGLLFPETLALWRELELRYGVTIRAVRPAATVDEQAAREGPVLWTRDPDRCCSLRKVQPLRAELRTFDAWVSAIRRDQTPERAMAPVVMWDRQFGLVKINPLVRWSHRDVWNHLQAHEVPYNPLHDRGYPSIGCMPCTTTAGAHEDTRAGRWRGREKTECGLHLELRPERNEARKE